MIEKKHTDRVHVGESCLPCTRKQSKCRSGEIRGAPDGSIDSRQTTEHEKLFYCDGLQLRAVDHVSGYTYS